ncbi:MAG: nitroreductase family protein [Martelella sp.]
MDITLAQALSRRRSVRAFAKHAIPLRSLEKILWAGQGKSGEDDGKTVPSAHALYPLRLFVMASRVEGLESGLYAAEPGGLDLRSINHADLRPALCEAAIGHPEWIANAACIIAICADMLTPVRAFVDSTPMARAASATSFWRRARRRKISSSWRWRRGSEAFWLVVSMMKPRPVFSRWRHPSRLSR